MAKKIEKLSDVRQQQKNANLHSERGMAMLEKSMNRVGYTAPMIAAADGEIISGSARHEVAAEIFGDESSPIVIESDGTRPIVVVRTDIPNASDSRAKEVAVMENRVAEVNLVWEPEVIQDLRMEIPDTMKMAFSEKEFDNMAMKEEVINTKEEIIPTQWVVVVTCKDEVEQCALLEKFMKDGLDVKALVS